MTKLLTWLRAASNEEKQQLYQLTGITRHGMHQMAHAYKTGGILSVSPESARKIEQATGTLARKGLPKLLREELSTICGACELPARCRR